MSASDLQDARMDLDPALLKRHADWWQRKGLLRASFQGTPLGDLWLPLADGTLATTDMDLRPEMLDVERLIAIKDDSVFGQPGGDAIIVRDPYSRVPWVEAILGCPIRATIAGGSMRTKAAVRDWDEWHSRPHRDDAWLDLLKTLVEGLAANSEGRYAVAQTLMRGPSDLAEAVLGPELMCLSMYDSADALTDFLEESTATFIDVLKAQLARMPQVAGGYVNPFGIWSPGTVVRTQCDASAILSPRQYAEWYLPYDTRICRAVDFSIIHLHSCSLHVVEALLAVERPQAIQITLETGPNVPSLAQMVPIFRRILAHKPLIVDGPLTEQEEAWLVEVLPHTGLYIRARRAGW